MTPAGGLELPVGAEDSKTWLMRRPADLDRAGPGGWPDSSRQSEEQDIVLASSQSRLQRIDAESAGKGDSGGVDRDRGQIDRCPDSTGPTESSQVQREAIRDIDCRGTPPPPQPEPELELRLRREVRT